MINEPREALQFSSTDRLGNSLEKIALSDRDAELYIIERIKMFSKFLEPSELQEIRGSFTIAIELTNTVHRICKGFIRISDSVESLAQFSMAERIGLAGHALRAQLKGNLPESQVAIYQRTEIALMHIFSEYDDPPTIDECLELEFNDDAIALLSAKLYAKDVVGYTYMINVSISNLMALSYLSLLARGIFYHAIVKGLGSEIARTAQLKAIKKKLESIAEDGFWSLAASIPIVGQLIVQGKDLLEWISLISDKEALLLKAHSSAREHYGVVKSFVETYTDCLTQFMLWVSSIQDSLIELLKGNRKLLNIE